MIDSHRCAAIPLRVDEPAARKPIEQTADRPGRWEQRMLWRDSMHVRIGVVRED